MRRFKQALAFTAAAASLLAVSAAPLAAGSTTFHTAEAAARSDYRIAVARCSRLDSDEQPRCMQDAEAARSAARIRARNAPGDAKLMDLNLLPDANDASDPGTQGGGLPTYRELPDVPAVPDNLASNDAR